MKILDKSLELAVKLYPQSNRQKVMVFCFIYNGNRLLSIGTNDMIKANAKALYFGKRFAVQKLIEYPFLCAEVSAISKLWGKHTITNKDTVVVVRLKSQGSCEKTRNILIPALAKPCKSCKMVLDSLGVTKIFWSTEEGFSNGQ